MLKRLRLVFLLFISLMLNLWGSSVFADTFLETAKPVYRVLFISSYNAGFDTLPAQVKGLKVVFDIEDIKLDIDYMDTKQVNEKDNYDNYYAFLKFRLQNIDPYDVVLVGDDNGLQFLMDNRDTLFPTTPLVFFCINDLDRAKAANEMPNTTGIIEGISLKSNLELATDLFPTAKKIYGIVDDTPTGVGDASSFMTAALDYPNYEFELLNASEYVFEDFKKMLTSIDTNDIVFYMSYFEDLNGNNYSIDESATIINATVKAPVFRMSIGGIGKGILGGNMVSYEEQGRLAASIAVSIIQGENPNEIQMIQESPNQYFFDYAIMKRFGLSKMDLPEGSIIINEPEDYFELYKSILLPTFFILTILILFIAILVRDNIKLKAKDKLLYENNLELTALYEEMMASEEELRSQYDQLTISEKYLQESEERYRILAFTDTLTGLSNRTALMRFLDLYVMENSKTWVLLYIDLDNFKYINDSSGHEIGDEILRQVGIRLSALQEDYIYLSRLGGDEFVMIVEVKDQVLELDGKKAVELLIRKIMDTIESVIEVNTLLFYLTCSVGISCYPKDGIERTVLLRKADMAMYQAKFSGRSRYEYFDKNMEDSFTQKLNIQNQMRFALENHQFKLLYQPQYDFKSNKMIGSEALIRWCDNSGNFIPPSVFIPMAEEQGLIQMIGKWVYEEAAKKASIWYQETGQKLKISVNVSALELSNDNFANEFMDIVNRYQLDPDQVAVEITESILISAKEKATVHLEHLREFGIKIHLDDFGAGYSSLNYMITLPLDVIKIDRQFINDMITEKRYEDMIRFIIDISHCYGLKVIAEGVETKAQFEKLRDMQCDMIQGYYYAKPMAYEELLSFNSTERLYG